MTSFDYAKPLATANRLIERYGQLGAVQRPGASIGPAYNPTIGSHTNDPARFVVTGWAAKDIDGTRIKAADKKALVAPGTLPADPTTSDLLVEANGTPWKIVGVETLRPAETTLLYTLQVRK